MTQTRPNQNSRLAKGKHPIGAWFHDYRPYIRQSDDDAEIPAFEIIDDGGEKIAETNENRPRAEQERHAKIIAAAPDLFRMLEQLNDLLRAMLASGDMDKKKLEQAHEKAQSLLLTSAGFAASKRSRGGTVTRIARKNFVQRPLRRGWLARQRKADILKKSRRSFAIFGARGRVSDDLGEYRDEREKLGAGLRYFVHTHVAMGEPDVGAPRQHREGTECRVMDCDAHSARFYRMSDQWRFSYPLGLVSISYDEERWCPLIIVKGY